MLKKNQVNAVVKKKPEMNNQPGNESISSNIIFDLQEIEMAFLMERKQIQDYNFYCRLSIAGFYLSVLFFVWYIIVGG